MRRILTLSAALAIAAAMAGSSPPAGAGEPAVAAARQQDPAVRTQAMIDRGLDFLKTRQQPDGGWHSQMMPPAITAIVLRAMVQDDKYSTRDEFVRKGYQKLISYQGQSGGIYKDMLANYNTAIAVSALAAADDPAFKDEIDKAVAYLKDLQWTDQIATAKDGQTIQINSDHTWYGGAGYGRHGRPDGSNTQLMIEALNDAGLPKDDPAFKAALKFVTRMQNLSETNDQPWSGNDGGAVYTPANNGESFAGEYTGPDGKRMLRSYGSMTYAMLKSYIYAGLSRDDPRVKAAWDWIRRNWTLDENPGMRAGDPASAGDGLYYYYLTLARALHAYGQPVIVDPQGNRHDWRIEFIDKMASLQKPDGSWVGDRRWMEDNPTLATAFSVIALQEALRDLKQRPPQ
jgi:squalene-hopene/tetraprenyl-beta-curcumene cyclase